MNDIFESHILGTLDLFLVNSLGGTFFLSLLQPQSPVFYHSNRSDQKYILR